MKIKYLPLLLVLSALPAITFANELIPPSDIEKLNKYCSQVKQAFKSLSVQDLSSLKAKKTLGSSNIKYIQPNLSPYLARLGKLGANNCTNP